MRAAMMTGLVLLAAFAPVRAEEKAAKFDKDKLPGNWLLAP